MKNEDKNKIYFVSDIHIGRKSKESEEGERKFIDFCKSIKKTAQKLYLVGDIFEFWFEYKTVIPSEYFKVICALRDLITSGTEIIYVGGNHDFWKGNFLTKEIGINVYFKPIEASIGKKKVLIHHGDGFLRSVLSFRFIKKILRNRVNIFLYKLIHPDIGIPLGKIVARAIRENNFKKINLDKAQIEYRKKAIEVLNNSEIDVIIMGHTHKKDFYSEDEKIYVNLGYWPNDFSYVVFEGGDFKLKKLE
jgi:UDP-2,3-diacylglucosamine hydrolase